MRLLTGISVLEPEAASLLSGYSQTCFGSLPISDFPMK